MAIIDLNPRDYARLFNVFRTYREKHPQSILPPLGELVPVITSAFKRPGDIYENLAEALNEPVQQIRNVFSEIRGIVVDKHGEAYADDVWNRFLKKGD